MTEVEFSTLLSDLTKTAATLNQESNDLNDVIAGCEDMLRRLNVGLEVWLDSDPLESDKWIEEYEDRDAEIKETERGTTDVELGFVDLSGDWHLALRRVRYETLDLERNLIISPRLHDVRDIKRLLDCSRRQRIAALKRLPALVAELKREAEDAVKAIEAAKKLVR